MLHGAKRCLAHVENDVRTIPDNHFDDIAQPLQENVYQESSQTNTFSGEHMYKTNEDFKENNIAENTNEKSPNFNTLTCKTEDPALYRLHRQFSWCRKRRDRQCPFSTKRHSEMTPLVSMPHKSSQTTLNNNRHRTTSP